jgi:hypothetical protein
MSRVTGWQGIETDSDPYSPAWCVLANSQEVPINRRRQDRHKFHIQSRCPASPGYRVQKPRAVSRDVVRRSITSIEDWEQRLY